MRTVMTDASAVPLFVPAGHFYSPIPDPVDVALAFQRHPSINGFHTPGIAMDDQAMRSLWQRMQPTMTGLHLEVEKKDNARFYLENGFYSYGDALVYASFLDIFQPKRVIEIGSGFSSALLLDLIDIGNVRATATFIEPYPAVLNTLLTEGDFSQVEVIQEKVQNVSLRKFDELKENDILFIDSSHVAKTGSDVCFEIFEILPVLAEGVIVHFHDIFANFEYPKGWALDENRGWNEIYLLRAFLTNNLSWKIVFFNDYFFNAFPEDVEDSSSDFKKNPGGGLWLQKVGASL